LKPVNRAAALDRKTTGLYERRNDEISVAENERIGI
jgi:hypothetical protein